MHIKLTLMAITFSLFSLILFFIFRKPEINVKIHIHEKNQFFDLSGRMGHEIKVGEKISSQINIHEVHQLPKYFNRNEMSSDAIENQTVKKYDTVCSDINFDECIQKELTRQMISATEDKCVVPWFPTLYSIEQIGNHTVCSKEKDVNTS